MHSICLSLLFFFKTWCLEGLTPPIKDGPPLWLAVTLQSFKPPPLWSPESHKYDWHHA